MRTQSATSFTSLSPVGRAYPRALKSFYIPFVRRLVRSLAPPQETSLSPVGRSRQVGRALKSFHIPFVRRLVRSLAPPYGTSFSAVVRFLCLTAAILFFVAGASQGFAADLKLEAQLIWGTNDPKSPDAGHKPAEPEVRKKLKSLPFKWENYFEVNRLQFAVPKDGARRIAMSKECEILVKNLGNSAVEVSVFGKGERVGKITQALPKGELLVTGGNAPNFTAWFVVLRQTD